MQTRVVRAALDLLPAAGPPPVIADFDEPWPGGLDEWKRAWHPKEPSPIIRWMHEQAAARARDQRGTAGNRERARYALSAHELAQPRPESARGAACPRMTNSGGGADEVALTVARATH